MDAPQLQFFDRGRCARAARWISGHFFLSPFLTVPLAEVTRQSWRLLDEFHSIFRRGHVVQHLVTVDTYSSSAGGWLWKIFRFYYVAGRLGSLGRFFPLVVTTLVVNNGSGMYSTGFACLHAPRLRSRRVPAGAVVAHTTDHGNRESDSRCGADRGVLPQIIGNCGVTAGAVLVVCGRPCDQASDVGSHNLKCLRISSSRRLRTSSCATETGTASCTGLLFMAVMAVMRVFPGFSAFFALLWVVPELSASFRSPRR